MSIVVSNQQLEALREIRNRLQWRQPFLYDAGMTLMNVARDRIDMTLMDEATQRHFTRRSYNPNTDPRATWWNITQMVVTTKTERFDRTAFLGWFYVMGQEPHLSLRFEDQKAATRRVRSFTFGFPPQISAQRMIDMSGQLAGAIDLFVNVGAIPDGIEPVGDFLLL